MPDDADASGTLYAFYDFQLCPVSFDFVTFVVLARLQAEKSGCERIHFVFVPGPADGFRDDDVSYDLTAKRQRLHNILLPLCSMLDLPVAISLCTQRAEADHIFATAGGAVFPLGYTVSRPTATFLMSAIVAAHSAGETIPSLCATDFARRNAAAWLHACCPGPRPVVITLREARHAPTRNSNLAAWLAFARGLDRRQYQPILVRDTDAAILPLGPEFDGLTVCPIAPVDLHFRHALYELAFLNLFIPNGPAALCWLNSRMRFIAFNMVIEGSSATSAFYHSSMGLALGGQVPFATPFQRLVWEADTLDVIEREFADMAVKIGDAPTGVAMAVDSTKAEDPMAVAVRLHAAGRLEEAATVYHEIVSKDPNNADTWSILGILAHQAAQPEMAEKMIGRAIRLKPNQANFHINLAAVLRAAGRTDEAVACLWRALALNPEDAGAHAELAELLQAQGANEEAKQALLNAVRLRPNSQEICERAARVLQTLGHAGDAANLYRRAIELREAHVKAARQARSHMPEIPVASLKRI